MNIYENPLYATNANNQSLSAVKLPKLHVRTLKKFIPRHYGNNQTLTFLQQKKHWIFHFISNFKSETKTIDMNSYSSTPSIIQRQIVIEKAQLNMTYQFRHILYSSLHFQTHNLEFNIALLVHLFCIVLRLLHKLENYPSKYKIRINRINNTKYYQELISTSPLETQTNGMIMSKLPVAIRLSPGARIPPGGRM
jgi:hypothetical protein